MNHENDDPSERRAWRTGEESARLRERITARDPAASPLRLGGHFRWIAAAAAVLLVGAGMSWRTMWVRQRVSETPTEHVATTGVGERLTILLADSSVVTLGPVSKIRYSASATARNVSIEGIAGFNVVHDSTRPFRVRAKNAVMTDVGTAFVVRAYAADSGVDVSVTSGVVAVAGGTTDSVELRAGQVALVTADGRTERVAGASAKARAAWIDDKLVFDDVPLGAVAAELGRWYEVEIRIPDQRLARRHLSATYTRATLTGVLDAIAATFPVRYQRTGNIVTLLPTDR